MKFALSLSGGLLAAAIAATSAIGDSHVNPAVMSAVKARQAHMQLQAFNIGLLGAMAKGEIEYDAEAASAAANNLAALAQLDATRYWPPGSDNANLGDDATEALPAIWKDGGKVMEKNKAMQEAALAMEQAAGGGLDALRGAMGALGKSCGGCHESYRKSDD